MANEYADRSCQRAYETGISDTLEELFPDEPSVADREWFDSFEAGYDRENEDIERAYLQQLREDLTDALDEQMNWPHR